jgi:hypothetical protein
MKGGGVAQTSGFHGDPGASAAAKRARASGARPG